MCDVVELFCARFNKRYDYTRESSTAPKSHTHTPTHTFPPYCSLTHNYTQSSTLERRSQFVRVCACFRLLATQLCEGKLPFTCIHNIAIKSHKHPHMHTRTPPTNRQPTHASRTRGPQLPNMIYFTRRIKRRQRREYIPCMRVCEYVGACLSSGHTCCAHARTRAHTNSHTRVWVSVILLIMGITIYSFGVWRRARPQPSIPMQMCVRVCFVAFLCARG